MCLVAYQRKRLVAQTDLPVLKIVNKVFDLDGNEKAGVFTTPYLNELISVPSTVKAKGRYNPMKIAFEGTERIDVSEGMIHLYRDDYDGLLQIQSLKSYHPVNKRSVLVRGVIPAGTLFSPGEGGEVCAKTVRYISLEVSNTVENDERIFERCKQLLADYCDNVADDPWEPILNKILLETDVKEKKED